jgi:exopolysaccharide biosynthesis polyprenyl glycosylphosphotransferase
MTVVDLRERFGLGWLAPSIPGPRRSVEVMGSSLGRELYGRPRMAPMWRLDLLDAVMSLLGVVVGGLLLGGVGRAGGMAIIAMWLLALHIAGGHRLPQARTKVYSMHMVVKALITYSAAIALLAVVFAGLNVGLVVSAGLVMAGLTVLGRRLWGNALVGVDAATSQKVLVRGDAANVAAFLDRLEKEGGYDATALQITEGSLPEEWRARGLDQMSGSMDVVDAALAAKVDSVMLVGAQSDTSDEVRRSIWRLEGHGFGVYLVPVVADVARPTVSTLPSTGIPVLSFTARDMRAEVGVTKVVIDKVLALVVLVVLAPVIVATALAVKLTSDGPVFFRQVRVGLRGREFEMLKFRTMYTDAEERRAELETLNTHSGGTLFKIPDDPRITSTGRILRKYSLDELPQLINVLRGEMALVGPRPPLPEEVANYPVDAHRRFCVRPGLTGLWQVSGRSNIDPEESVRLDSHYVEQWSPGMDVSILARTPKAVISGEGAY